MSREVKVGNEWVRVAGRGKAEYGASHYQTGVVLASDIGTIKGHDFKTIEVVLAKEMPDTEYIVTFSGSTNSNFAVCAQRLGAEKFYVTFRNTIDSEVTASMDCNWQAFKLYSDKEYDELLDDVAEMKKVTRADLALASGVSISGGGFAYFEQSGNTVCLHYHGLTVTPTGSEWTLLGTIPSGIGKPARSFLFSSTNSVNGVSLLQLNTAGQLYLYTPSVTTQQQLFAGTTSFIVA